MKVKIRKGKKNDLPHILALIKELAQYENAPDEVEVSIKALEEDGFGKNPIFEFYVAEYRNKIIGMALYYIKYSTWKGRCVFLDDIIVTEKFRNRGVGAKLFEKIIQESKKRKVKRLEWQVLDWNKPAIEFYKKYKAQFLPEWITCRLSGKQLTV